jgi:hypothetical protein
VSLPVFENNITTIAGASVLVFYVLQNQGSLPCSQKPATILCQINTISYKTPKNAQNTKKNIHYYIRIKIKTWQLQHVSILFGSSSGRALFEDEARRVKTC